MFVLFVLIRSRADFLMVFISHANPEDNRFALWLATKLATEGYPVWCDLIDLVGGECFWDDIEDAIRNHASKVIVIFSKSSSKAGVKDEINCAVQTERSKGLGDFVIPCRVDDVAFESLNIQLGRKNVVDCHNWAAGLAKILQKLEKDGVQKNPAVNAALVSSAWNTLFPSNAGITQTEELYDTNRIRITDLPTTIWANDSNAPGEESYFPVSASIFQGRRFSFQPRNPRQTLFASELNFERPEHKTLELFLRDGWDEFGVDSKRARHVVVELLSKSWNRYLRTKSLEAYELSGNKPVFYFHSQNLPGGEIPTQLPGRTARNRTVWGAHTVLRRGEKERRFYHLAWEGRVDDENCWHLILLPHIVWTYDGLLKQVDKDEQHRLRRKQCKGWWNDRWRGFLYATLSWASNGTATIEIPVGGGQRMMLEAQPLRLKSPVTHEYADSAQGQEKEESDD